MLSSVVPCVEGVVSVITIIVFIGTRSVVELVGGGRLDVDLAVVSTIFSGVVDGTVVVVVLRRVVLVGLLEVVVDVVSVVLFSVVEVVSCCRTVVVGASLIWSLTVVSGRDTLAVLKSSPMAFKSGLLNPLSVACSSSSYDGPRPILPLSTAGKVAMSL